MIDYMKLYSNLETVKYDVLHLYNIIGKDIDNVNSIIDSSGKIDNCVLTSRLIRFKVLLDMYKKYDNPKSQIQDYLKRFMNDLIIQTKYDMKGFRYLSFDNESTLLIFEPEDSKNIVGIMYDNLKEELHVQVRSDSGNEKEFILWLGNDDPLYRTDTEERISNLNIDIINFIRK